MELVEQSRLQELETQIERDKKAFYRIGMALVEIRDSRLYREEFDTFEDYCRERWEISRIHAHRFIEAASVQENLLPIGNIQPANEAQVRPLTKLETPEAQQEAWEKAVKTAPEGGITARHVSQVVKGIKLEIIKKEVRKKDEKKEKIEKEEIVDEEFKRAYDEFYWQVKRARLENWKNTSKEASKYLVSLIQDLMEVK